MHPPLLRTEFTRNRRQLAEDALAPSLSHLLLLLLGQLHLLSLFLYLRSSQFLLLIVGSQELLSQTGQLVDHPHELPFLLSKALGRP